MTRAVRLAILAAGLAGAATAPLAAQQRRPLDVRTFLSFDKPSEPAISL